MSIVEQWRYRMAIQEEGFIEYRLHLAYCALMGGEIGTRLLWSHQFDSSVLGGD